MSALRISTGQTITVVAELAESFDLWPRAPESLCDFRYGYGLATLIVWSILSIDAALGCLHLLYPPGTTDPFLPMSKSQDKLDCFVRVITPENIEFEYALAGPFQRLPAFLFDFGLRAFVLLGLLITTGVLTSWIPIGSAVVTVLALLSFFALSWFYGIYFETRFNGRTPGKMVFKLRVISVDGRPINASQAALRNLLRLADMGVMLSLQMFGSEAPPAYMIPTMAVGLVVMTISPRMQRVGDLAAGTMVVSEQRRRTPWNLNPEDARAFGLADLIPATFRVSSSLSQTIGLFMENRQRLSPMRRNEIARHLTGPLIREFGLLPDTSPDLLLCALYVRIYLSEEQQVQGRQRLRQRTPPQVPPQYSSGSIRPVAPPAPAKAIPMGIRVAPSIAQPPAVEASGGEKVSPTVPSPTAWRGESESN